MSFTKFKHRFQDSSRTDPRIDPYPLNNDVPGFPCHKLTRRMRTDSEAYVPPLSIKSPRPFATLNESVNQRLSMLLKVQSPRATVLVQNQFGMSHRFSPKSNISSPNAQMNDPRWSGAVRQAKDKYDVGQLMQTNEVLQNQVRELSRIVIQLTPSENDGMPVNTPKSKFKSGFRTSNGTFRNEPSLNEIEEKYRILLAQSREQTVLIQKQKHGLVVLLKLVRQELHQYRQGGVGSQQFRSWERERNQLQDQNARLESDQTKLQSEIEYLRTLNRGLEQELDCVTRDCKKNQKHNSLMLYSGQITQRGGGQSMKTTSKDTIEDPDELTRKSLKEKDQQVAAYLQRIRELQVQLLSKDSDNTTSRDYQDKLKEISHKLLLFEGAKREQLEAKIAETVSASDSKIACLQQKLDQGKCEILRLQAQNTVLTQQNTSLAERESWTIRVKQSVETSHDQLQRDKLALLGEKSCLIQDVITLKDLVSMSRINQVEAIKKLEQLECVYQEQQSKHSLLNNRAGDLREQWKNLVVGLGYSQQALDPSSEDNEFEGQVRQLQWLKEYIYRLRECSQKSKMSDEQEQLQYISKLNQKLNDVCNQNSKLKGIMAQSNIDYGQRLEDIQMDRLESSLRKKSKLNTPQLETIKEENIFKQNLQVQRLETIKKRLSQLQETSTSGRYRETQSYHNISFSEECQSDKLMGVIQHLLCKIKKSILSKQAYYTSLVKNVQLELSVFKEQNSLEKMNALRSKIQTMSVKMIEQDQRIRQLNEQSKLAGYSTLGAGPNKDTQNRQTLYDRKLSFNFKTQSISSLEDLQNYSETRLVFGNQVSVFLSQHLGEQSPGLYNTVQQLILQLQGYPDRQFLFGIFQGFLDRLKQQLKGLANQKQRVKVILSDYVMNASYMFDSGNQSDREQDCVN